MASYIRRLIRQHKPKARTLLELACGTGAIIKTLAKSYHVVGLDLSPQILSIARQKLPHVRFYCKDMVNFDLGKKFDVIMCVRFNQPRVKVYRLAENIPQCCLASRTRWVVPF
jgi:ubiquinone/menaquinone biosynthesis C-methylase UbiE